MPLNIFQVSLVALLLFLTACGPQTAPQQPVELTVFAAASLTESFTELGQQFTATHPGVTMTFNFAGSQQLAQQLRQGAPADVFASANAQQMSVAIQSGRIISGAQSTFARNRLVVIYPASGGHPAQLSRLQDLARPGLRIVLAAKEVPAGQYALDFLAKAEQDPTLGAAFKRGVMDNVQSYEENVRAVLTKVSLGEADAGIVYTSDLSGKNADKVGQLAVPDALNTVAQYPLAVVSDSAHAELAQAFVAHVLSPAGQTVLARYGFTTVSR